MEDFDTLKAQKDAIERRAFQDQAWVALRDIEDYALGKITLGRLSEILGQSPPVLRRIIVRAGKWMEGEAGHAEAAMIGERQRCAKIARRYCLEAGQDHWQDGMIQASQIAHEIETGNKPE